MQSHDFVLGIDGGGSKTVAWLARRSGDEASAVVGRGTAGGSNLQALGGRKALENLSAAIDAAFADAGLPPATVAATVAALAGSDREENRLVFRQWAETRRLAKRFRVTHDAEPVLAAGSPEGWGVALIAGTGSLAYAVSRNARTARAGGWGYLFGDEGSGYWIAIEGLRLAAHAADGRGPETRLLAAFLDRLKVTEPLALIGAVYPKASERASLAALAELVLQAAELGDEPARSLLDLATEQLAKMVAAAARQAGIMESTVPLAATGGVLLHGEGLLDRVCRRLAPWKITPLPVRVPHPVWGAVLLARRDADLDERLA